MKTKLLFALCLTTLSTPALADVPFRLDCASPAGELVEGSFTLLTQPDPEKSAFEGYFQTVHLLTPGTDGVKEFVNFEGEIDPKLSRKNFWQGESQDFYEITQTGTNDVETLTLALEGDLLDLVEKSGAGALEGVGRISLERKNGLNPHSSLTCRVSI
jgi:hypothetical protein